MHSCGNIVRLSANYTLHTKQYIRRTFYVKSERLAVVVVSLRAPSDLHDEQGGVHCISFVQAPARVSHQAFRFQVFSKLSIHSLLDGDSRRSNRVYK